MKGWGPKHSPFWPLRVPKKIDWADDAAWGGGPDLRQTMLLLLPVVRCYFLLGHRVTHISFLDFQTTGRETPPSNGYVGIHMASGKRLSLGAVAPPYTVHKTGFELEDDDVHIVFHLEEVHDETGYLNEGHLSSPHAGPLGYGVPLAGAERALSLGSVTPDIDALRAALTTHLTSLMGQLLPIWEAAQDPVTTPLARATRAGLLWVFDPSHWAGLPTRDDNLFWSPKNVLRDAFASAALKRAFLYEQVFDTQMAPAALSGTIADDVTTASSAREAGGGRPNLARYDTTPNRREGVSETTYQTSVVLKVSNTYFFVDLMRAVDHRGASHIWSLARRRSYSGQVSEAWLDTILALAWEGAISLSDAVVARDPPEPIRIEERYEHSAIWWYVIVHQAEALKLKHKFAPNVSPAGKFAYDYKPGKKKGEKPTVMLVAGRGIEIEVLEGTKPMPPQGGDFAAHYRTYFDEFGRLPFLPWKLEIFRVQDDALIPPPGATITPSDFLQASQINPTPVDVQRPPGEPNGPLYTRNRVSLDLPILSGPNAGQVIVVTVRIKPLKHGTRIEFPVREEEVSTLPADAQASDLKAVQSGGHAFWDILVNPFSGEAGFTFDLFLEEFSGVTSGAGNMTIINLHPVIVITGVEVMAGNVRDYSSINHVQIKTSLDPAVSSFERMWSAIPDLVWPWQNDPPPPPSTDPDRLPNDVYPSIADGPTFGPIHNTFLHSTAEFWKVKSVNLPDLAIPLGERLPVTNPPPPSAGASTDPRHNAHALVQLPGSYNRLIHANNIMPATAQMMNTGFGEATFGGLEGSGGHELEVTYLRSDEWIPGSTNDLLYMLIDLALGQIPIVGDIADIAEFAHVLCTGRDRWGRPASNFDIALMAVGAMVPFLSSSALTAAGTVVSGRNVEDLYDLASDGTIILKAPRADDFFRRFAALLSNLVAGEDPSDLKRVAGEFLDLNKFDGRFKSSGAAHDARVQTLTDELVSNKTLIVRRFGGVGEPAQEDYLKLADLQNPDGSYRFSILQTDATLANTQNRIDLGDEAAALSDAAFLRVKGGATTKAASRAFWFDDAAGTGARIPGKPVNAPTLVGRRHRGGVPVRVETISGDDIIDSVIEYLKAVAGSDERILIQGAGYGPDNLAEAKIIFRRAGFGLPGPADIDAQHPFVQMVKTMLGGEAQGYPKRLELLNGERRTPRKISPEECGARVAESLIMSADQVIHNGDIWQLRGNPDALGDLFGGAMNSRVRATASQWLFVHQSSFEHAIKSEVLESTQLHKRVFDASDPADEFAEFSLDVQSQGKLIDKEGSTIQMGADEVLTFSLPGPSSVRVAGDLQLKSSKAASRTTGIVFSIDPETGNAVPSHLRFPWVETIQDVAEDGSVIKTSYKLHGGSEMTRQVASQRLRQAQYGNWSPPKDLDDLPLPADMPDNPAGDGWAYMGTRHAYTLASEQLLDTLAGAIFRSVDEVDRGRILPHHLGGLDLEQRRLMQWLFPDTFRQNNPVPLDLNDGEAFHLAFDARSEELRDFFMTELNGYEQKVPGLIEALQNIRGTTDLDPPHGVYLRFTSDQSLDEPIRFILGLWSPDAN